MPYRKFMSMLLLLIAGCSSASPLSSCGTDSAPVLYQLSPDTGTLMNGYIIKKRRNKLIVIDGGGMATRENNTGYLYSKLQEISGKEVPEIEAWFLTHMHDDHINEFLLISKNTNRDIKIKNIYCNFPSRSFMAEKDGCIYMIRWRQDMTVFSARVHLKR